MPRRLALVLLFSGTSFAACKSTYDANKKLDGPQKCFSDDGKLESLRGYSAGKELYGKNFWPNGKPKKVYEYGKTRKTRSETFREDGTPIETWVEYEKTGEAVKKVFYDDGKLQYSEFWKNEKLHGIKTSYNADGTEEGKECYQNGTRTENLDPCGGAKAALSSVATKFPDGKIKEVYDVRNGKKEGERKVFSPNGHLLSLHTYRQGKLEGPVKEFYESGKPKSIALYSDGRKVGKTIVLKDAEDQ